MPARVDAERRRGVAFLLAWPAVALLGFVAIPFGLLLAISVAPNDQGLLWGRGVTLRAYGTLADPELVHALLRSLELALLVAAISLALGFPLTYLIVHMRRRQQVAWLVFLLTTLSLSDVLIAFSWQVMLSKRIGLSGVFVALGLMDPSDSLTPSNGAVIACLVYLVMPFTVLTLYPVLSRLDRTLIEAARTLGASPSRAFLSVVIPLTRGPAMIAFLMAAVLTLGAYVPLLVLGRPQSWTMAVLIGGAALAGHDLPRASAMSIFLLGVTILLAVGAARLVRRSLRR
jgi:putative spermidine/putrescine transport system permease protein